MSAGLDIGELRETIRGVLQDRSGGAIVIPDDAGRGLDRALWAEMAELGWLALPVPEAFDGLGLGIEHLAVLYEELGREVAAVPILSTMMAATVIARHGDEDTQARWLPAIARGEVLAALALPDDGPVPSRGADGALSGTIAHMSFADVADLLLMPVAGPSGAIALALVPRDAPGVTVTPRPLVDLTRSAGEVVLADARPVATIVLDAAGWAWLLDHAALGLACDAIGGCDTLLERTGDYLMVREQFGRPIGSFQALKHRMADWKVRIEAARMLARHAAAVVGAGEAGASGVASGAKAYACDLYAAFAGDAVQLHGGIGFTWEHPCHLFLKRAKLSQQLSGSSKFHKERVAALVFGEAQPAMDGVGT